MLKTLFSKPLLPKLSAVALAGLAVWAIACGGEVESADGPRVIVLGFDGMDYSLSRELIAQGALPNFARLVEEGSFLPLETSVPPLSPVAWSSFVTGMDAGGHGIFDFIHRDPDTMLPSFSITKSIEGSTVELGDCLLPKPWDSGESILLRRGTPFWEPLEARGIRTSILRMPANYPPTGTATHELTGMGTPDVTGSYGTFSFYTSKLFAFAGENLAGGEVYEVWPEEGVLEAELHGPPNPFDAEGEEAVAPFTVYLDPDEELVKIVVDETEVILAAGEWSSWVPVEFELSCGAVPFQTLHGIVRFYLRSVRPEIEFYVSPINFDPMTPDAEITSPPDYATELAEAGGRFYTQGMPEDTQALKGGVLTPEEFLAQAEITGEEIIHQYEDVVLPSFKSGFLFYYFGNTDLISHMMWRTLDTGHPGYDPTTDPAFADAIREVYQRADDVAGTTLDQMSDDDLLIIMSDHGFASWRRAFSLNTWLAENGYLGLKGPYMENDPGIFANVDWSRTRAYGAGINGLYLNLKGREKNGIVDPEDRGALLAEIRQKLLETIDPQTGLPAITKVYKSDEYFEDKGALDIGPDLVIGYAKGTRGADNSALGEIPAEILVDNLNAWSGDHGMDHEVVPGILFTSRPLKRPAARLKDLAASILYEFGIEEGFPAPAADED